MSGVVKGLIVPGLPHPLLCPDQNESWQRIRDGFDAARDAIAASDADVIVVYSTMWPSVIGHQIQAHPHPEWEHVDELFHHLGTIPYRFDTDTELAHAWSSAADARGLQTRTVAYDGFPMDTGSVVALKLLNPTNRLPSVVVSSNVYADRAETLVLGKATDDALRKTGRKAVAVVVSTLSNRLFTDWIEPADDRIHSDKDDEWNRKLLEFLGDGRLEDCAQLSREIHQRVRVPKVVNFKPLWWLSGAMGSHNRYDGTVHAYGALHGTGAAVVELNPTSRSVGDKEFDEEDVEVYRGDRSVLGAAVPEAAAPTPESSATDSAVNADDAPAPVGAYPHARRVGPWLYLSGVGPRQPGTDAIPGGAIRDGEGNPQSYDVRAQTHAVIDNIERILRSAGARLDQLVDVTSYLVDMDRDFAGYNEVYAERLGPYGPTRTTVAIDALPTPIAVELKVVAYLG